MRFVNMLCLMLSFVAILGCGSTMDDLNPSGTDKRPEVQTGTTGPAVGQKAPEFTLSDTLGNSISLSSVLPESKGIVLYFTMWCPVCDTDMSHMRSSVMPSFPDLRVFLVDYVSGSVADARNAAIANGYAGPEFTVLADTDHGVSDTYHATMGTTVVIDTAGVVRMNEEYKDGARLMTVLGDLP